MVTDQKINRLMEANKKVEQLMVAVDSFDNVEALGAAACKVGKKLGLLVDFEVGGKRTGLADEEKAVYLAKKIYETDGLIFTPCDKSVGSSNVGEITPSKKVRWDYSLKWKPPEFNSIDLINQNKIGNLQ